MHSLTLRNRVAAVALLAIAAGAISILLVVGLMVLAALAVGGVCIAAGITAYRRLRGGRYAFPNSSSPSGTILDPALEVFPAPVSHLDPGSARSIGPATRKVDSPP
jgi:hypothetical protein